MRVLNVDGRLSLGVGDDQVVDVERASFGQFDSDVQGVYAQWDEFRAWAERAGTGTLDAVSFTPERLGPPAPTPRQVFAVGLNYQSHADEAQIAAPPTPMIFTKFPASIAGPFDEIELPSDAVDYEAELVIVIGRETHRIAREDAWDHVAGLTCGQDYSERNWQTAPPNPQQFSLGKSFPGFGPIGPSLVTPDEFANRDDLAIECVVSGETLQSARTSQLMFGVADVVSFLASVVPMYPGDVVFTGTPSGVGWARDPKRPLKVADQVETTIEGIGTMRHRFRLAKPQDRRDAVALVGAAR